jgi:hypothetical protein
MDRRHILGKLKRVVTGVEWKARVAEGHAASLDPDVLLAHPACLSARDERDAA